MHAGSVISCAATRDINNNNILQPLEMTLGEIKFFLSVPTIYLSYLQHAQERDGRLLLMLARACRKQRTPLFWCGA